MFTNLHTTIIMRRASLGIALTITILACGFAQSAFAQGAAPMPSDVPGLTYDAPFFPGATHDPAIPTPDFVLGFEVGSRPATHAQIEAVFKAIAEKSPRTKLFDYAKSHEGRTLHYLAVSSEANIARLDQIKADIAKLADPRNVSVAQSDQLAESLPAVAWMAYVIHGDEMSGSDAALALAWHLASCTDDSVKQFLNEVVVLIDPLMNPDGRDRCIKMIAENRTAQPSVDDQSLIHSQFWPSGRMNHYLFDMNRDWIFGTQPESRGRIAAAGSWHPQLFIESHEMGSQDTFLFSPPREPVNPNMPASARRWWDVFARDQAAAFDRMGWRYYTGEWNEEWYPGYSSAWAGYRGAADILYEQASIASDGVRRAEGTIETYRESVHHQLVSSMANLKTLRANRREVLREYVAGRRANVAAEHPNAQRVFAVLPSSNIARIAQFTDLMHLQGFEMFITDREMAASGRDRLGREFKDRTLPPGTLLIPNRQPESPLISAMLEFDPRMTTEFLNDERRELLRFNRSKLYDVTGWNITMLFDVAAFELTMDLPAGLKKIETYPAPQPTFVRADSTVGFVVDGADDRSVALAGRLMEREVRLRVADKTFQFDGRDYPHGSLLVTRVDNQLFTGDLVDVVRAAANELGLSVTGITSGLGPGDLPDIGGEHFILLHQPRIAVIGRDPVGPYGFGETWHLIDHVLGLRASYLDANQLGGADLRRYNVVVIPAGDPAALRERMDSLKQWVRAGGTLVVVGSSARAFCDEKDGLSSVRLLPDVLGKMDEYRQQIVREWEGRMTVVDPAQVWTSSPPARLVYPWLIGESGDDKASPEDLKRRDEWRSLFMPQGAVLAGRVDDRSWLTAGCGEYVPVVYGGGPVLMAKDAAEAPVRLGVFSPALQPAETAATTATASTSPEDKEKTDKEAREKALKPGWSLAPPRQELRLRMSGLLWPEAADRIAHSAYVTRERIGSGQVILFASPPTFRAAALGTRRVLSNAMIYGPGMGASQPIRP